jgi:hypothetical protein
MNEKEYKGMNPGLLLTYMFGVFFLYPLAATILMYDLNILREKLAHGKFWLFVQVFISGPGLIIVGAVLMLVYKRFLLNKIFGMVLFLCGIYWIYRLVTELMEYAGIL